MNPNNPLSLSNKAYDTIKFTAQILLPALGTLYFAIAAIWNLPAADQVVGTIVALDTFLGIFLGLSSQKYAPDTDGALVIDTKGPMKDVYSLELATPLQELSGKKTITLHVHGE